MNVEVINELAHLIVCLKQKFDPPERRIALNCARRHLSFFAFISLFVRNKEKTETCDLISKTTMFFMLFKNTVLCGSLYSPTNSILRFSRTVHGFCSPFFLSSNLASFFQVPSLFLIKKHPVFFLRLAV
jgi:hypothetical protein